MAGIVPFRRHHVAADVDTDLGRPVAEDEKSNAEKDSLLPILGDGASAPDDNDDDDDDDIWSGGGGGNEVFQ